MHEDQIRLGIAYIQAAYGGAPANLMRANGPVMQVSAANQVPVNYGNSRLLPRWPPRA